MATTVDPKKYITQPESTGLDIGGWTNLYGKLNGLYDGTINAYTATHPELRRAKIPYLQALANTNAELNARSANALERQVDPKVAAARDLLKTRVLADASEGPSKELSSLWTKAGLQDSIATGAESDSGFARSAFADKTRSDYIADHDLRTDRLGALVDANPQQPAGLDIGAIVSRAAGTMDTNANNRDVHKAGIVPLQQQGIANLGNSMQQVMQTIAQQREFDAQQQQQYQQALLTGAVQNANFQNQQAATNTAAQTSNTGTMWAAGGAALGALAVVGVAF